MKSCLVFAFCSVLFAGSCTKGKPDEPEGTPVVLTQEELGPKYIKASRREWYAWHTKGVKLMTKGSHDEALYCLHRALEAWPAQVDAAEEEKNTSLQQVIGHKAEATDTILLLGSLYMKMQRPGLAKHYFEKFKSYFPYDNTIDDKIRGAREMMEAREE